MISLCSSVLILGALCFSPLGFDLIFGISGSTLYILTPAMVNFTKYNCRVSPSRNLLTVNPSPGTMLLPVVQNGSRDARLITELTVKRMAVLYKAVPRDCIRLQGRIQACWHG